MWTEESLGQRINHLRADEVIRSGAKVCRHVVPVLPDDAPRCREGQRAGRHRGQGCRRLARRIPQIRLGSGRDLNQSRRFPPSDKPTSLPPLRRPKEGLRRQFDSVTLFIAFELVSQDLFERRDRPVDILVADVLMRDEADIAGYGHGQDPFFLEPLEKRGDGEADGRSRK